MEQVKDVPAYIRQMYTDNHFMTKFGVHIGEIKCGSAEVSIDVDPAKHFNHRDICHGGVMLAFGRLRSGCYRCKRGRCSGNS